MLLTLQEAQCNFVANTLKRLHRILCSAFHTNGQCESRETNLHTNILIPRAPLNYARERESPPISWRRTVSHVSANINLSSLVRTAREIVFERTLVINMWPAASRNRTIASIFPGWVQRCFHGLGEETKLPVNLL